jgi:lambda family phage portal protein
MKPIDKILNVLGLTRNEEAHKQINAAGVRGWTAAKNLKSVQGWSTQKREINREIKSDLTALQARAQDLRYNNPVVSGYIFDYRANVVGAEGFDYQPAVKSIIAPDELDEPINRQLKEKFDEWSHEKYCCMDQRTPFIFSQYFTADQLAVGGEFLVRMVTGLKKSDNPFGISQELLDPVDIDTDYNVDLGDSAIIMGIEFDKWRRIKNIYLKRKSIYGELTGSISRESREPIPYDQLLFGVDLLHSKAARGISPLAPVMLSLMGLDMWENYALDNAKASAAKMGFITTTKDAIGDYYDESTSDIVNEGETTSEDDPLQPGTYWDFDGVHVEKLPLGYQYNSFDPKYPSDQHNPFVRALGRKIAMGLGADWTVLSGDREMESYSSMRGAELKMRRMWSIKQTLMRHQYLNRLTEKWLASSLLYGAIPKMNMSDYPRLNKFYWQGVVQPWVDMAKEATAFETMRKNGWIDDIDIITQGGRRAEEVLRNIAAFKKQKEKLGLTNEDFGDGKVNNATSAGSVEQTGNSEDTASGGTKRRAANGPHFSFIRNPN